MKPFPLFLTILFLILPCWAQPDLQIPENCSQLVVVKNEHWDDTTAVMQRFERCCEGRPWKQVGSNIRVNLGRTGLAWGESPLMEGLQFPKGQLQKREGDGRSPAGVFPILKAFGHPKAPKGYDLSNLPFMKVKHEQCVDDKNSPYYNQVVDPAEVGGVSWDSAETMKISLYELGLVVGHNCPKAKPGFGSCIFFHLQGGPNQPTAGCTSMTRKDLTDLCLWLKRDKSPILIQLPVDVYAYYGRRFPRSSY